MTGSSPRHLVVVGVAVIVAVTCVGLGFWQLRRLGERRAMNAAIERDRSRDPVLITTAVGSGEVEPYIPVRASGAFDPDREVIVYGRGLDGSSGHHVVTPLVFDDGTAVLVVRGWIPFEYQTAPVADAAPPTGELTIRGFLVPDEGDGSAVPDANGVIGRLDVKGIRSTLPYPVFPLAVQLTEQVRPQPSDLPVPIPEPELSEGPHLSYAIQWFSFAAVAVAGAAVLLRRDRRSARGGP
jgi:cytochrome oxidase assembly protein ShyY1